MSYTLEDYTRIVAAARPADPASRSMTAGGARNWALKVAQAAIASPYRTTSHAVACDPNRRSHGYYWIDRQVLDHDRLDLAAWDHCVADAL